MHVRGAGAAPVRVCMLSFYFYPAYSGSAVQAHNLCRQLLPLGVQPIIVSANLTSSPACELIDGISVHRLPLMMRKSLQIPSFAFSLAWFLLRHRKSFDIVHAHGAVPHFVASLVARLLGKKSVLKIAMTNSDIAFRRQGRFGGRLNRFLFRLFDRFVATSEEAYQECLAEGRAPDRVHLLPNGVDTVRFCPAASPAAKRSLRVCLGLPDEPIVCFVGVLDERKNVDGILRVWRQTRLRGSGGYLLLIGPESVDNRGSLLPFAATLRQYVAENRLTDSVIFAGQQPDVAEFLRAANVFIFPSRREGMPNVLLEAMASGLASIVSSIGGNVDLIRHGQEGYVFGLDDESDMADCLVRLLADPAQVVVLGTAARLRIERKYSLTATAHAYVKMYGELLSC